MPDKHYLSDADATHTFPTKRHVSAPSRYTPVQPPRTPLFSPITQAPSPISPGRDDLMMMDEKLQEATVDDIFESALLTPQETKRSTASPPVMFDSPRQSRPASLDGGLAGLAQRFANAGIDIDMDLDDDESDNGDNSHIAAVDGPQAIIAKYFNQSELNPDIIVLKNTIEMLRKRRAQCLTDINSLANHKRNALDHPERFAERVIAASRGAQKTSVHQGKHHWRLEQHVLDLPEPIEYPKVPEINWSKYGVPPMYATQPAAPLAAPVQLQQSAVNSVAVQDMINPNRMSTRATNTSRITGAKPVAQQGLTIRTGLDMNTRQRKNSLMSYSNPFANDPTRHGRLLSVGYAS
ncbi:hypothetical protein ABW19_dt0207366 [Dactylella cylindrospora]|nr:hypothetical protein ABW19_dt0207366 [Dactylella cylindrospora]